MLVTPASSSLLLRVCFSLSHSGHHQCQVPGGGSFCCCNLFIFTLWWVCTCLHPCVSIWKSEENMGCLPLLLSPSLSKKLAIMGRLAGQRVLRSICLHLQYQDYRYTAMLDLLPGCCRFAPRSPPLQSQLAYPLSHLLSPNNTFTEVRLTERETISQGWVDWFPQGLKTRHLFSYSSRYSGKKPAEFTSPS